MIVLAIMSYPGGNYTLKRHWPYVRASGADKLIGVGPYEGHTEFPEELLTFKFGSNCYISGSELPNRLVTTIDFVIAAEPEATQIVVAEYDTVFFHPVDFSKITQPLASHYAGGPTWSSKAKGFYHNPWAFSSRETAKIFTERGHAAIAEGVCAGIDPTPAEGSPDVFVGYIAQELGWTIQTDLWSEYSRNDLQQPDHLKEARAAYRAGIDVIHGIKTQKELRFIIG